ncbi:tripartite tricarboxylate transporter substrate binding protein [soil metagenome]
MRISALLQSTACVLTLWFGLLVTSESIAQGADYPTKPIRLVVAYPAGGGADALARTLAQKLTVSLGQAVVVENRVGASGILGTGYVAKAPPDGYTLLMMSTTQVIASRLFPNVPYDLSRSFTPVAFIGSAPLVLVVNGQVAARSVKELLELSRTRQVNYASAAIGTVGHLSMEMLTGMAHVQMLHVPYKGTAPATNDLLGGQVDAMMDILPNSMPYLRSGQLRALAVTSAARSPDLPDVPTLAEAGLPGYEVENWYGVLAPLDTPAPIVQRLNRSIAAALADAEIQDRLYKQGYSTMPMALDRLARLIASDSDKWATAIQQSGTKPE